MIKFLDKEKKKPFLFSYGAFLINGMLALSIGSLLPFIREAKGLDYAFSGLLVSIHSVGNLAAGFLAGVLAVRVGRKRSILLFESLFFISFCIMIFGKNRPALLLAFLLTGLARGASSNFNNTNINGLAPGKAWAINGLHAMFATGAFLFPLLLTLATSFNAEYWIYICYFMLAMGILVWLLYFFMPIKNEEAEKIKKMKKAEKREKTGGEYQFFKEPLFLLCTAVLFVYLCAEQGVIGWLITYFEDSGLLSPALSQIMASVLWIMILAGRLTVAWLSTKVKKENMLVVMGIGFALFFFVLLFGKSAGMIVVGIMGFGFSMAGIYPTTVSVAGYIIQKYQLAWSFMLTLASFGSIIMPTVIGKIAQQAGIVYGMWSVVVAVVIDLALLIGLKIYLPRLQKD
ncbi:MAG: MFS transporter [Clostridium sp.]|nr:MFS transporter [Clostridium sp.]